LKSSWIASEAILLKIEKLKHQCVNNQVSSATEEQNLKAEEVIMCCLASAATYWRVQWQKSMEKCWIHEWTEKTDETEGKKKFLQCPFSHPEFHTKWCKIQLQLYSQKNYLTSGFNNIYLKCAQHNCIDTPLILHCPFTLEPLKNNGKYSN
jgi:hypothetical protein